VTCGDHSGLHIVLPGETAGTRTGTPEPDLADRALVLEPEPELVPEPEPADTGTGTALVPAIELTGRNRSRYEELRFVIRHWAKRSGKPAKKGNPALWAWWAQPESLGKHRQYLKSRAWVPEGHKGGFIEWGGVLYHILIARPLKAVGNLISGLPERPIQMLIALPFIILIIVIILL